MGIEEKQKPDSGNTAILLDDGGLANQNENTKTQRKTQIPVHKV